MNAQDRDTLLHVLKTRFETNMSRHKGLAWSGVQAKLDQQPDKLHSLHGMESSGGEPDVVEFDKNTGEYVFYDCSPESPAGRRSICYDREGLDSRKANKPDHNAVDMAGAMGVTILTEDQYRNLQQLGTFDARTSSWLLAPADIRNLGGAIFGDFRFGRVFVYHNGAQSYYSGRGFRSCLRV